MPVCVIIANFGEREKKWLLRSRVCALDFSVGVGVGEGSKLRNYLRFVMFKTFLFPPFACV